MTVDTSSPTLSLPPVRHDDDANDAFPLPDTRAAIPPGPITRTAKDNPSPSPRVCSVRHLHRQCRPGGRQAQRLRYVERLHHQPTSWREGDLPRLPLGQGVLPQHDG